jgi:glycerol-3-phosphate O-acyltransferase
VILDEVTQAVLSRDEIVRYLRESHEGDKSDTRERIHAYLEELRTTQRYPFYRALKHPLYPIFRKLDLRPEHVDIPVAATRKGRVIYASNHKSHLDYLVEPVVLDDHGIRPPIIAAGINLFGGPLGLLHRHITGAMPVRRNTKDPAYLVTLKAYVAELLQRHDLLVYLEGGRSYNGAMKSPKTGLLHAALQADRENMTVVPVAIAYDLVLEDQVLAKQGTKRSQRPFTRELTEMVRYGMGYHSRAFVTFGSPMTLHEWNPESRRSVMDLAKLIGEKIGKLHKVLPTALLAAALRPSMLKNDLIDRVDGLLDELRQADANLSVASGAEALEQATEPLVTRGIIVVENDRYRVRERTVLRYYARTIKHLLSPTGHVTH